MNAKYGEDIKKRYDESVHNMNPSIHVGGPAGSWRGIIEKLDMSDEPGKLSTFGHEITASKSPRSRSALLGVFQTRNTPRKPADRGPLKCLDQASLSQSDATNTESSEEFQKVCDLFSFVHRKLESDPVLLKLQESGVSKLAKELASLIATEEAAANKLSMFMKKFGRWMDSVRHYESSNSVTVVSAIERTHQEKYQPSLLVRMEQLARKYETVLERISDLDVAHYNPEEVDLQFDEMGVERFSERHQPPRNPR